MEYVVYYWTKDGDQDHVIFCNSKEEAELKAKGVDTDKFDDIEIMTREEYDDLELEYIENN